MRGHTSSRRDQSDSRPSAASPFTVQSGATGGPKCVRKIRSPLLPNRAVLYGRALYIRTARNLLAGKIVLIYVFRAKSHYVQ